MAEEQRTRHWLESGLVNLVPVISQLGIDVYVYQPSRGCLSLATAHNEENWRNKAPNLTRLLTENPIIKFPDDPERSLRLVFHQDHYSFITGNTESYRRYEQRVRAIQQRENIHLTDGSPQRLEAQSHRDDREGSQAADNQALDQLIGVLSMALRRNDESRANRGEIKQKLRALILTISELGREYAGIAEAFESLTGATIDQAATLFSPQNRLADELGLQQINILPLFVMAYGYNLQIVEPVGASHSEVITTSSLSLYDISSSLPDFFSMLMRSYVIPRERSLSTITLMRTSIAEGDFYIYQGTEVSLSSKRSTGTQTNITLSDSEDEHEGLLESMVIEIPGQDSDSSGPASGLLLEQ